MRAGNYALGLSVFCLGTTEFMVSGLLPMLASDFGISIPQAGWLISVFALTVALGAPPLTVFCLRLARKAALVALLAVFAAGQVVAAIAPTFAWLVVARVLTALAFGPFFAVGAVAAVDLAGSALRGRAIAVMFGGLTIANVVGVPEGAFIGAHFGWRASFWSVALFAAVALGAVIRAVPSDVSADNRRRIDLRQEAAPFKRPIMWTALAATALSQAALFAVFSYIAPLITAVGEFSRAAVPPLLVLFGLGTVAGTYFGGRLADRFLKLNLLGGLAALIAVLAIFGFALHAHATAVIAVFLFGVTAFVINPGLQTEVMRQATVAPNLASAVNISAFNVGNTVGPWLGGLLITANYGYRSVTYLGAVLALGALGAVFATAYMRRQVTWRRGEPEAALMRRRRPRRPPSQIGHEDHGNAGDLESKHHGGEAWRRQR